MILLEELDTEFGHIRIVKSKENGRFTYYQNGCSHSEADIEGASTCAYVHVMYSVIRQSQAQRVLMIGCAGGTLATMLHRLGCHVTVVDINPYAFMLAKKYFNMPEEIDCIEEDGWYHLVNITERYDAIAVDAFNNDGTIAGQFILEDFFHAVRKALGHAGIVVMNVILKHDFDMLADRIALNIELAGIPSVLFDWERSSERNIIVAGGKDVGHMQINSDKKPVFIKHELQGIVRRKPITHRSNKTL
jgi:spermidine synthase